MVNSNLAQILFQNVFKLTMTSSFVIVIKKLFGSLKNVSSKKGIYENSSAYTPLTALFCPNNDIYRPR
jgi:hypothetical protein